LQRALANIRRWSGNGLRHGWRAFKLGPGRLGWFCWYSLLDQRLAMWTVLVGPLFGTLALLSGHFEIAAGYVLWVMFSRVAPASISWRHGRRFSAYYLPLQILSDWTIALAKVWVLFHPARQNWLNRGARALDTTTNSASYRLRTAAAHYLYGFACTATVIAIGIYTGFLPVFQEAALFFDVGRQPSAALPPPASAAGAPPVLMFGADVPATVGSGTVEKPPPPRSVHQVVAPSFVLAPPQP